MGKICTGHLLQLAEGEQPNAHVWAAIEKLTQVDPVHRPKRGRDAAAIFAMAEKALIESTWDVAMSASLLVNKTRTQRAKARLLHRVATPLTTQSEPHEVLLAEAISDADSAAEPPEEATCMGVLQHYRASLHELER
jgi:hypothetical protein